MDGFNLNRCTEKDLDVWLFGLSRDLRVLKVSCYFVPF